MRLLLTGPRIFTGEAMLHDQGVLVEDGRILDIVPAATPPAGAVERRSPDDTLLAPGFIDTQVNGGGGVLFNDSPTEAACRAIARAHRRFGTTGLLPTFITGPRGAMAAAVEAAAKAAADPASGVLGIHLEGPFLAPARKGVHAEAHMRTPDAADIDALCRLPERFGEGRVLLSLAPEMVDDGQIAQLAQAGVIVAGAHSAAGYDRTRTAVHAGLSGFTHLFNAMPAPANREPGIVGAALDLPGTFAGIIADGIHVHPAMLRLAHRAKPPGSLFLVTDAMSPTGTEMAEFMLDGRPIHRRNGRLETADGTLAGADLDMAAAVRNAVTLMGVDVAEALRMASLIPARFLRLDHRLGRIAPGYGAHLVLLDAELRVLRAGLAAGDWIDDDSVR